MKDKILEDYLASSHHPLSETLPVLCEKVREDERKKIFVKVREIINKSHYGISGIESCGCCTNSQRIEDIVTLLTTSHHTQK